MDNRSNTIAGWILGAGIVALGATIVSGEYFHGEEVDMCNDTDGYCPAYVADAGTDTGNPQAEEKPIAFYLATADVAEGEKAFAQCKACHTINAGGANGIGPNLYSTLGKPIAGHAGFSYSSALSGVGGTWNWDNMSQWLTSPKAFASGTAMNFAGIKDPQRRASLMLYLNQNSASPLAVPPPPAEEEVVAPEEGAADPVNTLEEGTGDVVEAADGGVDVPEAQ